MITRLQADGVDEPWTDDDFCDRIVAVQREREQAPVPSDIAVQFFDRSPLCTLALARYLSRPVTPLLAAEVARVTSERTYQQEVFLVRPLGFVEATVARRISYADSLAFEAEHEEVYREHDYTLRAVPAGPVADRVEYVRSAIRR